MVVNKEKIVENMYGLRYLRDLPDMLNDWGYNWVYLPSREKYQITLGYVFIELYTDNSLEVSVEFVESEKYQFGNDFALLICRLVKNGYIKESENGKLN